MTQSILQNDYASSRCINVAKKYVDAFSINSAKIPLRSVAIGAKFGSELQSLTQLKIFDTGKPAGIISHCHGYGKDPVLDYVIVAVTSNQIFELIRLNETPNRVEFYQANEILGVLDETTLPRSQSFWEHLFSRKRCWILKQSDGTRLGKVEMRYPVDRKSVLRLELDSGQMLLIRLAGSFFQSELNLVIPLGARYKNERIEVLHFLATICLRFIFFQMDTGGT